MFRKCFSGAVVAGILTAVGLVGQPMASADELPSGQRTVCGTTVEPAYNAATGTIIYLSTTHAPVDSTMTVAPLYMPVYPVGAQEDALNCQHGPDNCPDHGPLIAGLAA